MARVWQRWIDIPWTIAKDFLSEDRCYDTDSNCHCCHRARLRELLRVHGGDVRGLDVNLFATPHLLATP